MHSRTALWILWAACLLALVGIGVASQRVPLPGRAWVQAETAVAGFVASLMALCAGVGSFAVRETYLSRHIRSGALDLDSPAGFARARAILFLLWLLCLAVGALGGALAWRAASPGPAWPYMLAAAVLLLIHAPRRALLDAGALAQD